MPEGDISKVTVSIATETDRPYLNVRATLPFCVEESELQETLDLMRRLRAEFQPDFQQTQEPPLLVELLGNLPVEVLVEHMGELAERAPFPVQKANWRGGYSTVGKTVGEVVQENKKLAMWMWGEFMKMDEKDMQAADKLGFAALSVVLGGK